MRHDEHWRKQLRQTILELHCSKCGAKPGELCLTRFGAVYTAFHSMRRRIGYHRMRKQK